MNNDLKMWVDNFLSTLRAAADQWSSGVFVLIKTIAALFGLVALMATIVVLTQWFIAVYGVGSFVFTLILSSFVITALTTKNDKTK